MMTSLFLLPYAQSNMRERLMSLYSTNDRMFKIPSYSNSIEELVHFLHKCFGYVFSTASGKWGIVFKY